MMGYIGRAFEGAARGAAALLFGATLLAAGHAHAAEIYDGPLPQPRPVSVGPAGKHADASEMPSKSASECLAKALYFEARGETAKGQLAVGRVILNRVKDKHYPDTICGVVFQNAEKRNRCQFSFACDGKPDLVADKKSWHEVRRRAKWLLACRKGCGSKGLWKGPLWQSTHYHADYVAPGWANRLKQTGQIGTHLFYLEARA
ncbi:cell wall hydrolase [Afifella sp. H1R]|uniref:cell wall hydrolase n=1 Tax=Afifella sp. H1R TaxID=2908841 RepID=UPI001F209F03|nr:cell wall hydrolase [Afifella sp. H1R]MCF1504508.1 cell wall hydrolase [Afifella sp. H1R]